MRTAIIIIAIVWILDSNIINATVKEFTGSSVVEWSEILGRKIREAAVEDAEPSITEVAK